MSFGQIDLQKRSEIESLALRTSSAALQLRFTQNDKEHFTLQRLNASTF
jgi:hypothetical protein